MNKKNRKIKIVLYSIFLIFVSLPILFVPVLSKQTTTQPFDFQVEDVFSFEEAHSYSYKGNITGSYIEPYNSSSTQTENYLVKRWTIEKTTSYSIEVTNVTNENISVQLKRHYSFNTFEEFLNRENGTILTEKASDENILTCNLTIQKESKKIINTTDDRKFPLNNTFFFWTSNNLTIGATIEIDQQEYQVINQSTVATYEGERNVTNVISDKSTYHEFIYSYILDRYVYFGQFQNQTIIGYGCSDGILVTGKEVFTMLENNTYTHQANGDFILTKNIDIVSSNINDPGISYGGIYWLIGGILTEMVLIYWFERKSIRRYKGTLKTEKRRDKELNNVEDTKRQAEAILPPAELK